MAEVVVGYDGSDDARVALRWAAAFAARAGSAVRVVQTWQYPGTALLPWGPSELPAAPEVERELLDGLEAVVEEVVPADVAVTMEVAAGPAAPALLADAARDGVDALVLGTRGLGGISALVLGSVSRQCLERSPVPVVVVPPDADPGESTDRILLALDGSDHAKRAAAWAGELAAATGAELLAVHAFAPRIAELPPNVFADLRREAEEVLASWCASLDGTVGRAVVVDGDPRRVLPEVAADEGADLVVMGTRGLGGLSRLMLGSVASGVVARSTVPVAVIPLPGEPDAGRDLEAATARPRARRVRAEG